MSTSKSDEWPVIRLYAVSEAKNNFSKMLEEAQAGTVIITNHGRPVAVVIGIEGISIEEVATAQTISEIRALIVKHQSKKFPTEES